MVVRARIPKGFRPKAQGCPAMREATLGVQWRGGFNPERVVAPPFYVRRGKAAAATTLSGLIPSLRPFPRVASRMAGQPWAGGHNPFGIEDACKVQRGLAHSAKQAPRFSPEFAPPSIIHPPSCW